METLQTRGDNKPVRKLNFVYDYMGRRVMKSVLDLNEDNSTYTTSLFRQFVYDGWNLVAETNENTELVRTYSWGQDLSGSLDGAGGIGGLIFQTDSTSGTTYFPAYDGNGNLTGLYRSDNASQAAYYEYSPYGQIISSSGSYADENPFRFSTKYGDGETGLMYFGYRYYNSDTGRWLNRDPIEEQGGLNLYSYVHAYPTGYIDPLGLTDYPVSMPVGTSPLPAYPPGQSWPGGWIGPVPPSPGPDPSTRSRYWSCWLDCMRGSDPYYLVSCAIPATGAGGIYVPKKIVLPGQQPNTFLLTKLLPPWLGRALGRCCLAATVAEAGYRTGNALACTAICLSQ